MNIKINHIAKMEGHAGFMASVLKGDVKSAKIEVKEGIRLIEGVLVGRHYADVPVVAQRICGICPVVHNLTSIKAIESAMNIKVSVETMTLRKLMELAQIIHSHGLHLFFLSLADFLDIENDLKLVAEYPEEAKKAIKIREYGMAIVKTIGGRVVHPLTNEAGGFKKVPTQEEVRTLLAQTEDALQTALDLGKFFRNIKLPEFSRQTEYVSLEKKGEYAIYEGDVVSSKGLHVSVEKFEHNFRELQRPQEMIKRVETGKGASYMIGAIARVNLQRAKLNSYAERYLESLSLRFPDYNPFHNILFQMVEVVHSIEECGKLLRSAANMNLENAVTKPFTAQAGSGVAAVEAPRGILFYHLDVDENGIVKNANIMTPTAQFLTHLEDDVAAYLPHILALSDKEREKKIRAIIRAYDPCISCAVH